MRIIFMGGEKAGMFGLMAAMTQVEIPLVVTKDETLAGLAELLELRVVDSIKTDEFKNAIQNSNALLCVHGREIIPENVLQYLPCINLHPCQEDYKGAYPIKRLLESGSIEPHCVDLTAFYMTRILDSGPIIMRRIFTAKGNTEAEIYNSMYPMYAELTINVLKHLKREKDVNGKIR